MKYQTISNRFETIHVKKSRKSTTVPDMSFTPREIIQKFSRGEKVPLGFSGQYDCEDYPDEDRYKHQPYDDPQVLEDDPTRDPDFDFGDYVEEKNALQERQRAAKHAQQRRKGVDDSKRKASAEELSASDSTKRATTSGEASTPPTVQADKPT